MLISGRVASLVYLIAVVIATFYLLQKSKTWKPTIRSIPALDALEEAVGRAVEMGTCIHFTAGLSSLSTPVTGPMIIAGLSVYHKLATLSVKKGARLVFNVAQPDAIPLAYDLLYEAYKMEGKPEEFDPDDAIRFTSSEQGPYAAAVQNFFAEEKPASNVMIGPFYAESILLAEVGARYNSFQIAGTGRTTQVPYFAIVCDYNLICEEIFAAGAYLSGDPGQLSSIVVQDIFKGLSVAAIILGILMTVAGIPILGNLLSL